MPTTDMPTNQTLSRALRITFLALLAGAVIALLFGPFLHAARSQDSSSAVAVVDATTNALTNTSSNLPPTTTGELKLTLPQMITPIIVPILIALLKLLVPRVPGWALPLLAPTLGFFADTIISLATGNKMNPLLGIVLGSAGVGVREALKHFKPAPATSAGTAALLFALGLPLLCISCATVEQTAYQKNTDPSTGIVDERESKTKVRAAGDAKQMVEKLRVTNTSKTQSLGTDGVSQESSLQGLVDLFKVFFDAGKEAGKKTVAPAAP